MGYTSTPRKTRARAKAEAGDEASTTAAECSPVPARGKRHSRTEEVTCQPAKGETTYDVHGSDGQTLVVCLDGTWRQAIWHHELVARLDKDTYGVHLYEIQPPRRNDNQPRDDITTFLPNQKRWAFENKEQRPEIVFQLYPNDDQYPERSRPVPWLEFEVDGVMKIVLDIFSRRPLRDFTNIPIQLATNVEGGRLEAMMREDCRIVSDDFLQRMIPLLDANGKPRRDERGLILSERLTKNSLNNVKTQFRNKCRCLSWSTSRHDSEFDKRLLSELTDDDRDANTTRNLRDLSATEVTDVRSIAKGRKSAVTITHQGNDNGAAGPDTSGLITTQNAAERSAGEKQILETSADQLEADDIQADSTLSLDPTTNKVIQTGTIAQRGRGRGRPKKSTHRVNGQASSEPSMKNTVQSDAEMIDPALLGLDILAEAALQDGSLLGSPNPIMSAASAPTASDMLKKDASMVHSPIPQAAPATSVGGQDPLPEETTLADPTNIAQTQSLRKTAGRTTNGFLRDDELTLKRKLSVAGGEDYGETVHVNGYSAREAKSPIASPKRQKILPPTNNVQQLLNDFSRTSRPGTPILHQGGVLYSDVNLSDPNKNGQPPPRSSQPGGHDLEAPLLSGSALLDRPMPYPPYSVNNGLSGSRSRTTSNSALLTGPRPYSPNSASQVAQQNEGYVIAANQAHFASVSARISELDVLKANLVEAWWREQSDSSKGGGLYGSIFSVSLSQLGSISSARTDAEMRSLMSAFGIPSSWSASSINLRQNSALQQAAFEAMCEAERWDPRNYLPNTTNGRLNLDREGAFFLARSQLYMLNRNDSRFWSFTSTPQLNASLHSAFWRYKQLTFREYAPKDQDGTILPAFLAQDTSYQDAWCQVRLQVFLPYFLRFADPIEAILWMPSLGMLTYWEGGPERWERSRSQKEDEFRCRGDRAMRGALDPRRFGERWGWGVEAGKAFLPLGSVDLEGGAGL